MNKNKEEQTLFIGAPFSSDLRAEQLRKSLTRLATPEIEDYEKEAFESAPLFWL